MRIGLDLIEIDRVMEKIARNDVFKEKVFSPSEIGYCEAGSAAQVGERYAGRFAAKEAFLKATGLGLLFTHNLNEIEVQVDRNGAPCIVGHGVVGAAIATNNWKIALSITHTKTTAAAVVLIG